MTLAPRKRELKPKKAAEGATTSSLAAEHAPRSVRARLFAAEKKKERQKKKGAAGATAATAARGVGKRDGGDGGDDLFSRAALNPFSSSEAAAPAKLRRGSHTLSGPDFGVTFKEPEAAMAAAAVAAEGELQQQARADAAEAARAETARRLGKADLPKRSRRGGGGHSSSAASQVRATRTLFQPQQK